MFLYCTIFDQIKFIDYTNANSVLVACQDSLDPSSKSNRIILISWKTNEEQEFTFFSHIVASAIIN